MKATHELETRPRAKGAGLRRTERIMLEIPIRVFSFGGIVGDFTEDTRTLMVNRDGALIVLRHRVAPDQIIRIVNLENLREDDFRVVGLARQESAGCAEWGVECMDKQRTLWEIDFPPPMENIEPRAGALLQCRGCGKRSFVVLSLTEVSMLDSSGALGRLCEKCGELKPWEYTEEIKAQLRSDRPAPVTVANPPGAPTGEPPGFQGAPGAQPPPGPALGVASVVTQAAKASASAAEITAPPAPWDRRTERRIHKRLTLKLPTLIRNGRGETEIERTENISKGGIGIGLVMKLTLGEFVAVVCPYCGGGVQIEQKAEVRRRVSLYGGHKWLYGLKYLDGKNGS